ALIGRHAVEAADVGAPVRDARHAEIEAAADLRLEGGKGGVDVARPGHGAEALHAGTTRAAEQEGPLVRPVHGFALGERLLAQKVEAVVQHRAWPGSHVHTLGRTFAAIQPPALDPELDELAVVVPPPSPCLRAGEIEETLAFLVGDRPLGRGAQPRIGMVEQVALALRLGEQGRVLVKHGVFVKQDPEMLVAEVANQPTRVAEDLWIELEMADVAVPAM